MQHEQEDLTRKVAILTRLAEVSTVLNSTLQLEPLLGYLMDAAAEVTNAEGASVMLWNNKSQELFFAATTTGGAGDKLIGKPVPLDSIAGTILRERRVLVVNDVAQDPRHNQRVDQEIQFQTRSILGVPMTSKERVIGVLEAINKRDLPWTKDDEQYLSVLAAQAAVAIESAQMVMALQKANNELNELDKLKNNFIAIASHELRTPLGIILGYASFLQDARDPEVNEHATKVLNSALQLRRIIEDMTNLRYLKQNAAELQRDRVALNELLDDLALDVTTLTEAKRHQLVVSRLPQDTYLRIDRSRVLMALTNIINNAVDFTPEGGTIIIEARLHTPERVAISVTDTGIGLEPEQLERIFGEFYQVEDHMTRRHGGLGIGLSIARALVEAHGGRIWASSPGLNLGTTITLILPLAE